MKCPNCAAPNPDDVKYCASCGQPIHPPISPAREGEHRRMFYRIAIVGILLSGPIIYYGGLFRDHLAALESARSDESNSGAASRSASPSSRTFAPATQPPPPRPSLQDRIAAEIRNLDAYSPDQRRAASDALQQIGKPAIPALTEALKNPSKHARYNAALLLWKIGKDTKNIPVLTTGLDDDDPQSAIWVANALGEMGPAAKDALLPLLESTKNEKVREAATGAIKKIGEPAVPVLKESLTTKSGWIRYTSALVLIEVTKDTESTLPVLRQAANEVEPPFRVWAAAHLPVAGPVVVKDLSELLRYDKDATVRRTAAAALGVFGPEAKTAIPFLVKALDDSDYQVQFQAVETLGKIGKEATAAVVPIEAWLQTGRHNSKESREAIEKVLEQIGPAPVALVVASLKQDDADVRAAAARSLGKTGSGAKEAVPQLAAVLAEDKQNSVRQTAAWALGRIGPEARDAVPALTKALADPDLQVQLAAVETLGKIGKDAASAGAAIQAWLQAGKRTNNKECRDAAEKALERIGPLPATTQSTAPPGDTSTPPQVASANSPSPASTPTPSPAASVAAGGIQLLNPKQMLDDCQQVTVNSQTKAITGITLLTNVFEKTYKGKRVKYDGVVDGVRKEQGVIVFKGSGNWPFNWHVQSPLPEDNPGLLDTLKSRDKLTIEADISELILPKHDAGLPGVVGPSRIIRVSKVKVLE